MQIRCGIAVYSEGYDEDGVLPDAPLFHTSRVATLYDLIPLHDPEVFLPGARPKAWYERRSAFLSSCDLLFCLSEWTAQEAVQRLHLDPERLVVIGGGVDSSFRPLVFDAQQHGNLLARFSITRPYVLYNGGLDQRKNVPALLRAFALLPMAIRQRPPAGCRWVMIGLRRLPFDRMVTPRLALEPAGSGDLPAVSSG